jgi:hypothetical protein
MKKLALIILMVFPLFTSACMNVSSIPLGTYESRLPANPDMVAVYLAEEDVPGDYKKIALIYAEEIIGYRSTGNMIQRVKVKAARAGANGIILNEINNVPDFSDMESGPANKKQIKAIAIYVKK